MGQMKKLITVGDGFSLKIIENLLAKNNISYHIKTLGFAGTNFFERNRRTHRNFTPALAEGSSYIVYVNKKDYSTAKGIV